MSDPVVEIPFSGGIDQSTRDELVDAARSFVMLENTRQPHPGAASKRPGYTSLGNTRMDGTSRSVGRRIFTNGDQICTFDGEWIDVHVPSTSTFALRSRVPEAGFTSFEVPSYGLNLAVPTYVADVAYVNGYIIVVLVSSGPAGLRSCIVSIIDATTKAVVRGPELILTSATNIEFGLATYGNKCVLGANQPALSVVEIYTLDTTSASSLDTGWSSADQIPATDSDGQLAMSSLASDDRIAFAYGMTSGTDRVVVITYGASGVIETVAIDTGGLTPDVDTVDMSENSDALWVCWAIAGLAFVVGLNPTDIDGTMLATVHAAGIINASSSGLDALFISSAGTSQAMLTARLTSGTTMVRRIVIDAGEAVAESPGASLYENTRFVGRPFLYGDRVYQWSSTDTNDDLVLCDVTRSIGGDDVPLYLRPVVAPILRGLRSSFMFQRCRTVATGESTFAFVFPVKMTGTSAGAKAIEIDFRSPDRCNAASYHRSTYLSGGVTALFDGSHVIESGFLCAPPTPGFDTATAGSLTLSNGGRRYVAVYASPDADGNLSISGVSNPTDATGNCTSKKVTIGLRPLTITMRGSRSDRDRGPSIQIFLYATADGGEEPYHLIKSIENDPQSALLTIEDEVDETTLATGALLYGSGNLPGTVTDGQVGGPQDHRAPPGLRFLTPYNGMLVGVVDDEIWHTSQSVFGEAPWWSPLFTQQIDEPPTGVFVMDGTLYVPTRTGLYALTGDPPNDAGTSGGLTPPRRLSIDRGCINPLSIVVTSMGAFYQSSRGIELFRQGGIEPIGDFVQETVAGFPYITSAVFDTTRGLVRFSLSNMLLGGLVGDDGGHGGRDIVFDLILGAWVSVDRKFGSNSDQPSQHAVMVTLDGERKYAWLAAYGAVYVEDGTTYLDPSNRWVTQAAETGWVHVAGLQGEQFLDRLLLLAKSVTDHDLNISIAYDYNDYSVTKPFTSAQIGALTRQWLDAEIGQTTSQAIRVKLEDATPSTGEVGTGEGGAWIALTFNGQPHRGSKRTSGAQRSG